MAFSDSTNRYHCPGWCGHGCGARRVDCRDGGLKDSHTAALPPTPDRQARPWSRNQPETLELRLIHGPPHHHGVSIGEPEEGLCRHEPLHCALAILTTELRIHQQVGGTQVVP